MDKVYILLTLLSFPSLINVTYFDGLQSDFSNLVLEIASGSGTSYPPYQITQYAPSQWAEVEAALPEENYTLSFLASFQGALPAPQNPENASLPENLPQDYFNISEQNGSVVTFFFNLTEGNISEQLNSTESLTVLYTFDFSFTNESNPAQEPQEELNITQNETNETSILPENQSNLTQNESIPPETNLTQNETVFPPPLQGNQNLSNATEQLNVTYFSGLFPDFSNLVVRMAVGAVSADLPHIILQLLPSEWALVEVQLPTDEPHTFEFYADVQNATNETNVSQSQADASIANYTFNVSWFAPLAPDFSNLYMQFIYPNNSTENISHGILEMSLSEWALVLLEFPVPHDAQVNALALDINATNETAEMEKEEKEKKEKEEQEKGRGKKKAKRGSVENTLPEIFQQAEDRALSFSTDADSSTEPSQYLVSPEDPLDYDFSTGDFSLSAWFRTSSEEGGTIIYRGSAESTKFYELSVQPGGTAAFSTGNADSVSRIESPLPYNDGNWHLATGSRQGATGRIYIDGVFAAEAEFPPLDISDADAVLSIGSNMGGYEFTQQPLNVFQGEISDPLIWGYALTEKDAAGLLHAGR